MNKKTTLALLVLIALLWAYPFYESITEDARSMDDLSKASRWLVGIGTGVFLYLMHPLFLWMWAGLKRAFVALKDWLDEK